jgi:lysophospholipase L1-like esterase
VTAVLCYGDSNTWGYAASTQKRLSRWERWPGVLQRELGDGVHVIEEGMNGRTTVFEVPFEPHRNGAAHLPVALQTHAPLEAVVISLGTNDLFVPGVNAHHAARGAMALAQMVRASDAWPNAGAPEVLVLVPPPFAPLEPADALESPHAEAESRRFAEAYGRMAAEDGGVPLLDLGPHATSSAVDGIHLEAADHRAIGLAVAVRLRDMLAM